MSTILMVSVILIVVVSLYHGFNQLTTIEKI